MNVSTNGVKYAYFCFVIVQLFLFSWCFFFFLELEISFLKPPEEEFNHENDVPSATAVTSEPVCTVTSQGNDKLN